MGPIRLRTHATLEDFQFLRRHTSRPIKMTLPGPSTLVDGTVDAHYGDEQALALACAAALSEEVRALAAPDSLLSSEESDTAKTRMRMLDGSCAPFRP